VAARLAHTLGLPAPLVFLGLGLALGESGAGIQFSDARVAEVSGYARWSSSRRGRADH